MELTKTSSATTRTLPDNSRSSRLKLIKHLWLNLCTSLQENKLKIEITKTSPATTRTLPDNTRSS